jgi:hypothetical protein
LIQSGADAAALVSVFDYYEAQEAASGRETSAHGVDASEHAVESEGHVVVFGELEDCEHAAFGRSCGIASEQQVPRLRKIVRFADDLGSARNDSIYGAGELGGCLHRGIVTAQVHDFFGQGEDAGLAGDYQETVRGIATEPARPLQAAGVNGAIEAMPGKGISD